MTDKVHHECPLHLWFGLSYAQYLTVPRSVLQSMPYDWRKRFAALLEELDLAIDWMPKKGVYWVQLREPSTGKYYPISEDPFMDYDRGRRQIPHREDCGCVDCAPEAEHFRRTCNNCGGTEWKTVTDWITLRSSGFVCAGCGLPMENSEMKPVDAVGQLCDLLNEAEGVKVTFDPERDVTKPCVFCGQGPVLAEIELEEVILPDSTKDRRPVCSDCHNAGMKCVPAKRSQQ